MSYRIPAGTQVSIRRINCPGFWQLHKTKTQMCYLTLLRQQAGKYVFQDHEWLICVPMSAVDEVPEPETAVG